MGRLKPTDRLRRAVVVEQTSKRDNEDHSSQWHGGVCSKNDLTGPTLLEVSGYGNQALGTDFTTMC
jgi:hypothetical protein